MMFAMKTVAFHAICYFIYWLLLRRINHFALNRAYLLVTLVLGFIAPLTLLPSLFSVIDPGFLEVHVHPGTFSESETSNSVVSMPNFESPSFTILITIIYAMGVLFLLVRSIVSIWLVRRIGRDGIEKSSAPKVVTIKEELSFAFINTIFLHESATPVVLLHETGHVKGRHWIDLLLMEIVSIVYWFSPIVWLYRRSLRQQHEYLADDYVLQHGISPEEYLFGIVNALSVKEPIGPVHNFTSHSLKQRIIMMTSNQISPYTKYLYVALVPLLSLLFLSFTGTSDNAATDVSQKVFVIDAAHGGTDIGSVSPSGVTEKEIALSLAKLVKEIGEAKGLTIHLTRATDMQLSLADRVKFSADLKADAFLSIHAGFDSKGIQKGLEVVVSEANTRYDDSKRFAGLISSELDDVSEFSNPVVTSGGAYVLKHNHAPGVIVEAGFLSDVNNTEFIRDPGNQRLVATQIVSALMKY